MNTPINHLTAGFIGLGLIGGSIARGLKRSAPDIQIMAYMRTREKLEQAHADGIVDLILDGVDEHLSECDIIFLCTPVEFNESYLRQIRPFLKEGAIVTDVGSTKTSIHETVAALGMESCFVGGHPMAGSEKTGYESSTDHLLENAYYIITPTPHTPASHTDRMVDVAKAIGALPLVLDYHRHDFIVAAISHLPHLIASSLVNLVHDCDSEDQMMKRLAAGGFKDITRIASSSPVMWEQICMTNTGNITEVLDRYIDSLTTLREELSDHQSRAIYKLFEEEHPDMVVNFAAESHVDRSIEDPGVFLQTNIIGTATMMDACRKYGIQRYHQVSTDEVYGDLPLDRPDLFFTEETPIHTSSPYSSSKAAADLLVQAYHRTYGLPVTISRCSNNYGPYHFPEKLIPLMIANALNDKPLPVYGEGLNVRDWLYVEDHCRAIDLIIHKGRVGEVYNVGGHNEMRNIDIVKLICKELGKPESLIVHVADRKGHDMRYAIDPTKIHNELGWLPETKFADGIKKTIDWYLNHREWWETIISGEYQDYYEKMYGNR